MNKIEFDAVFGNDLTHIEIAAPSGIGGATYFVEINDYYEGCLHKTADGWVVHLHQNTMLQGDDVQILIDMIEQSLVDNPAGTLQLPQYDGKMYHNKPTLRSESGKRET